MAGKKGQKWGITGGKISKDMFERMCQVQCSEQDICYFFNVSDDTLRQWVKNNYEGKTFKEAYQQFKTEGRLSLRRKQFEVAMNGSEKMLIHLGKCELGQSENVNVTTVDRVNVVADMPTEEEEEDE